MIYMQGREGLLQTRAPASKGPCKQGPQHDIQAKGPIQVYCREPLKTRAHVDRGPLHKIAPIQTKRPYRQGVLTYKGPLQTRGPHRQGVHTEKGPLQQRTPIDDV